MTWTDRFTSGAMLKEFVTWWAQQWLDLLPTRFSAMGRWDSALVIDLPVEEPRPDESAFTLVRRVNGRESLIGRVAADAAGLAEIRRARRRKRGGLDLLLRLPPGSLLEHRFAIPLAAERDAAQVLRYEIDRVTPFAAEEVVWTWAAERRDRERGRLLVRLSLASRRPLETLIRRLSAAGLSPRCVEAAAADGSLRHLPLESQVGAGNTLLRSFARVAAMACVILAVTAAALPFAFQQERLLRADRAIALLQPRVAEAMALRRRILGEAAGADIVGATEARVGDALQALAAVTNVLPDNTFLTAFSLAQRNIALTGQSPDPAGLIAALSADPLIGNPSFSAPVTAAPNGHGSLFSISANLAP
jgi:general secretion pathway protein L